MRIRAVSLVLLIAVSFLSQSPHVSLILRRFGLFAVDPDARPECLCGRL